MKFNQLRLAPVEPENRFETFCLDFFRLRIEDDHIQKNGRRGQRQNGVDLFCHRELEGIKWVGIQCKARSLGALTRIEIESEIEKATSFNPKLSEYIIATTARRDSIIQEYIRALNTSGGYSFFIDIVFWDDIEESLADEKYVDVLNKYFHEFFIDSFKSGFSIGRILMVHLGIEGVYTTQYELLVGKIPVLNSTKEYGIHYYQGLSYISCLQNQKIVYFSGKLYPMEIEDLALTALDAEMLCAWLNRTGIDVLLSDSEMDFRFSYTEDERRNFPMSRE